jgi:hypothetical protein
LTAPTSADPSQQLAWETRQRPRAGAAAIAAGVIAIGAAVVTALLFSDAPRAGLLAALDRALQEGPVGGEVSLRLAFFEFLQDRAPVMVVVALVQALGYLALAYALTFLASATFARRPEFPKVGVYVPLVGAVLSAVATLLFQLVYVARISSFTGAEQTVEAARDIVGGSLLLTAQLLNLVATLALAAGFVLVCLNAMRAGLLTRFMGVLGILCGALLIFPIGSPLPVVQSFWLFALGILFLGRWPGGSPPAWETGEAVPWPSNAEIRRQRAEAMAARRGASRGAPPAPAAPEAMPSGEAPAEPAGGPAAKRKRKRRA